MVPHHFGFDPRKNPAKIATGFEAKGCLEFRPGWDKVALVFGHVHYAKMNCSVYCIGTY